MEHLISFLKLHLIPPDFKNTSVIKQLANALFKDINGARESNEFIRRLLISYIPTPPIIRDPEYGCHISDTLIADLLCAYIGDGGTRDFKNILDPDSDTIVTDSDSDESDVTYHEYVDYLSE
jgi:hypothetical protein